MRPKRVIIFINGILTWPGDADNWNGKAVTWTFLNTDEFDAAEKVEYYIGPISRVLGQRKRAAKLLKTMRFYLDYGWQVTLVGHSNGANVIMRALRELTKQQLFNVRHLHLIAPAAPADFDKNGLNEAGVPVTIYRGTRDWALNLSSGAGRVLGYGALGKTGPVNVRDVEVEEVVEDLGHSGWFSPEHLWDTMSMVTRDTDLDE